MASKRMMKCPKKTKGECKATKKDCNHSGQHKYNAWCDVENIMQKCSCPPCVDVGIK
jgi:hypothetical protein